MLILINTVVQLKVKRTSKYKPTILTILSMQTYRHVSVEYPTVTYCQETVISIIDVSKYVRIKALSIVQHEH